MLPDRPTYLHVTPSSQRAGLDTCLTGAVHIPVSWLHTFSLRIFVRSLRSGRFTVMTPCRPTLFSASLLRVPIHAAAEMMAPVFPGCQGRLAAYPTQAVGGRPYLSIRAGGSVRSSPSRAPTEYIRRCFGLCGGTGPMDALEGPAPRRSIKGSTVPAFNFYCIEFRGLSTDTLMSGIPPHELRHDLGAIEREHVSSTA